MYYVDNRYAVYADQEAKKDEINSIPKVYSLDKDGKRVAENIPIEAFVDLSANGTAILSANNTNEGGATPYKIPDPGEDTAIRVTDVYKGSFSNNDVNFVINTAIGAIFGMAWTKLGGLLLDLGYSTIISESAWRGQILSSTAGTALADALSFAQVKPTYFTVYQYKAYSTYWRCYVLYQATTYYGNDSTYTNPTAVFLMPIKYYFDVGTR